MRLPYHTKDEHLKLFAEQRAGTLAALEKLSDDDLDQPAPQQLQRIASTVGAVFSMQPTHSGQWTVMRRKLGRKPLF